MFTFRTLTDNEQNALIAVWEKLTGFDKAILEGYIEGEHESMGFGFVQDVVFQVNIDEAGKRIVNALYSACKKLWKNEELPADWFENDTSND
jgi:hypothetical protein